MMRARGFTLVELLVAIFITAILFAIGYSAINQALANHGAIQEHQARLLALQTTVRILAQDFGQASMRPVREPLGATWQPSFSAQPSQTGQALVTLTRAGWSNPAGVQRPALQRVSYILEDNTLRRMHWPVLDATLSSEVSRRDLLTGVKSVALRYMDRGRQWVDQWPVPAGNPQASPNQPAIDQRTRPLAVEITLDLEDWGKIVRLFEIPQ